MKYLFILLLILTYFNSISYVISIDLDYKKYDYHYTTLVENKIRISLKQCETSIYCVNLEEHKHRNCVLKCISPKCYDDIYMNNPLEEGEFDIRYVSFKGCMLDQHNKNHNSN